MATTASSDAETTGTAAQRAAVLAKRMPLVHYPARVTFDTWPDAARRWPALQSQATRGVESPTTSFDKLRWQHVFVYAGPSCYFREDAVGDLLFYFKQSAPDGKAGGVVPFDSGSLEPSQRTGLPTLQPWKRNAATAEQCWNLFQEHRSDLTGWRDRFERWLVDSYDEPDRYLETTSDRFAAGEPARLEPPWLLEHNGTRGHVQYGGDCADRRAWTWELHLEGELLWTDLLSIQVPWDSLEVALSWAEQVGATHDVRPLVWSYGEPIDPNRPYDALYEESGRALRTLMEAP